MNERKLYEIAVRILGLFLLAGAVQYLGMAIHATFFLSSDAYTQSGYGTTTSILFLVHLVASVLLIALASRIAVLFTASDVGRSDLAEFGESSVLRIGITLIGVYVLVSGLPDLVTESIRSIQRAGLPPYVDAVSTGGRWISPTVRVMLGAGLAFRGRLFRVFSPPDAHARHSDSESGCADGGDQI